MNIRDFRRKKELGQKISFITCYDYPSARTISESSIDCILVGDSVAMTVHGFDNTLHASIEMMVLHTQAVARGTTQQFIVSDLPFLSHRYSMDKTIDDVKQLIQAGAQAIKIEGADQKSLETIEYLVNSGIPVMGHIGLTPQHVHQIGGFAVQGKSKAHAETLLNQALALQNAGCFALVIECVPSAVAKEITQNLQIPTIGIGAGVETDGQVLVWHDLLGLQPDFHPRFVKQYFQGKASILAALNHYATEVVEKSFPTADHTY